MAAADTKMQLQQLDERRADVAVRRRDTRR